ncbi:hypothetical protein diail_1298 [Diaporthe ilicicola]|nr:hypothetical protein diail_1298 [Diaporthe ilicicola]
MATFLYPSLDTSQPSIRLIRLIAGHGPIQCQMFDSFLPSASSNAHLTMTIPYEALSYTWGGTEKTETIFVNGTPLGVTNNLYLALSYLRREETDRILWVDAICIDQGNAKERTHQVRQMARIYESADAVILWLGQATYATNVALDSLRQLEEESKKVACRRWRRTDARWRMLWSKTQRKLARRYPDLVSRQREGIRDLLDRPWFERVWVIQEVANSRRALVCCGNKSVSASVFALSPHLFAVRPSDQAQAILDIMPGRSRDESWWAQGHDLYNLLRKFRLSKASDPRDMIYALVRIASDPELEEVLVPNYEKTEREVIQEAVSFLCHLDIELLPEVSDGYWNAMVDDQSMTGFIKSIDSLYAAAMDQHLRVDRGAETTSFYISKGHNVRLTNEMINMADRRRHEDDADFETPVGLIIRHHADLAMLENAVENWHSIPWLRLLLHSLPTQVRITETVMEVAMKNAYCPEVLDLLLQGRGSETPVTDRALYLAACSMKVKNIFEVLLRARGDQIRLTPTLVRMLEKNESPQRKAALEFLKRKLKATDLIDHHQPQDKC